MNVGLAIHYGGMGAFLLALIAGWLAVILLVGAFVSLKAQPRLEPSVKILGTLAASAFLFLSSNALAAIGTLTDIVSSFFCLRVPDGTARGFLIGALCTRLLALPVGVALMFFVPYGFAVLSSIVLAIIAWCLWIGFLRTLALSLKQPILAREAIDVTLSAVKLGVSWVVGTGTVIGVIFLMVTMRRLGGCFMGFLILSSISVVAGLARFLILSDRFSSMTNLFLYPTGIPLIMRYMDLIGTLRMIILRRA